MKRLFFFYSIFVLFFFLDSNALGSHKVYTTKIKATQKAKEITQKEKELEELRKQADKIYLENVEQLLEKVYETLDIREKEKLLKEFINQKYFRINFQDKNGQTILHIAAGVGLLDIVQELLGKNADVNIQDKFGNIPIYLAVGTATNASNIVELLLAAGANPNISNKDGFTPLHRSISLGTPLDRSNIIELLLKYGADPLIKTTKKIAKKQYNPHTKSYEIVEIKEEKIDSPLEMAEKIEKSLKETTANLTKMHTQKALDEAKKTLELLVRYKNIINLMQYAANLTKVPPQKPATPEKKPPLQLHEELTKELRKLTKMLQELAQKLIYAH